MIYDLAIYEGKDPNTLPVTKEKLKKYGFTKDPFFHVEIAEDFEGIIGYALYSYGYSAHQGSPYLYIDDLYVKPEKRGRGADTFLIKKLASYAKEAECCRMEWVAFDWNEKAISFYKNLEGILRKDLLLIRMEKEAYLSLAASLF